MSLLKSAAAGLALIAGIVLPVAAAQASEGDAEARVKPMCMSCWPTLR